MKSKKITDPLRSDKIEELYRLWSEPLALSEIEQRIEQGNYSPMDMFMFKAYTGEIAFLRALFQKVYPDQSNVEVDHKSSTMAELLNQLEQSKITPNTLAAVASGSGVLLEGETTE